MNSVTLKTGHRRLAAALALVGVAMLVFASVAAAQEPPPPSTYPPPPPSPLAPPDWDGDLMPFVGDADGDKVISMGDALAILNHRVGSQPLSESMQLVADVDDDTVVSMGDVLRILNYRINNVVNPIWVWEDHPELRDPDGRNAG